MRNQIVFDVDDILWSLNKRVSERVGIAFSDLCTFSIYENPRLSEKEKEQVLTAYNDPDLFKDIDWYPGAERIMELERHGIKVYINSNCCQKEIARLKYQQIHELINIPDDQLILNVFDVDSDGHKKKEIGDHVFAFVDDSPYNLLSATADHLYTLNKPWNTNVPELSELNIRRFDALEELVTALDKQLSERSILW